MWANVIKSRCTDMNRIIFLLALQFLTLTIYSQVDWSTTREWRLYRLNNQEALDYSVDTLTNFKYVELDSAKMHVWLKHATLWPVDKKGLFMGLMVGSYKTKKGKTSKVIFSPNGGYFYDAGIKRYYEIQPEFISQWNQYLNKQLGRVFSKYKF